MEEWIIVSPGRKVNSKFTSVNKSTCYTKFSTAYAMLPDLSADPPNNPTKLHTDSPPALNTTDPTECPSTPTTASPIPRQFKLKAARRFLKRQRHQDAQSANNDFFDVQITRAEDECTTWTKANLEGKHRAAIDISHKRSSPEPTMLQKGRNWQYTIQGNAKRLWQAMTTTNKRVRFQTMPTSVISTQPTSPSLSPTILVPTGTTSARETAYRRASPS